MNTKLTAAAFLAAFQIQSLFAAPLDCMSQEAQKTCGIERLNTDEKQALNNWLEKHQAEHTKRPTILVSSKIAHGEFTVVHNDVMGRFISLSNGITYDIPSRARKKTMSWKAGDKICLVEPINPTNFKLENLAQKHTIGAKIAKADRAKTLIAKAEIVNTVQEAVAIKSDLAVNASITQ
jgi:hypothetical protein